MIQKTIDVVSAQLRTFTTLNTETGKFTSVSEYPANTWEEGVVNAVTHRAYNLNGDDIRVIMYDDRISIHSPGDCLLLLLRKICEHSTILEIHTLPGR